MFHLINLSNYLQGTILKLFISEIVKDDSCFDFKKQLYMHVVLLKS